MVGRSGVRTRWIGGQVAVGMRVLLVGSPVLGQRLTLLTDTIQSECGGVSATEHCHHNNYYMSHQPREHQNKTLSLPASICCSTLICPFSQEVNADVIIALFIYSFYIQNTN